MEEGFLAGCYDKEAKVSVGLGHAEVRQTALVMEEKTALSPTSLQPEWTRVQVETQPFQRALNGLVTELGLAPGLHTIS